MPIPFVDPRRQHPEAAEPVRSAVERVLREGAGAAAHEVRAFEAELARDAGTRFAVGVQSGTSALYLALRALGLGPGDEVIASPMADYGVAEAVSLCGATPVFADVEPDTLCLSALAAAGRVTARTRAVVVTHLYGTPADVAGLKALADAHGLPLIEDATEAFTARYRGRPVGSLGRAGCYSFSPARALGAAGHAGAVVTDDAEVEARVRRLRDHGLAGPRGPADVGPELAMDPLQAAVLRARLPFAAAGTAARREVAARYRARLAPLAHVRAVSPRPGCEPACERLVVRSTDRDRLRDWLERHGIGTGVHYAVPLHLQPALRHLGHRTGAYPLAEAASQEVLSLPMHADLTAAEVDAACALVAAFAEPASGGPPYRHAA